MVSLVDIAPLTTAVDIQGQQIEVKGVSALGIAALLGRFPEFRSLISGREIEFTAERLMTMVPEATAAIIAYGSGGDEKTEAAAANLAVGDQADLLAAIITLTFPRGIGPFVEKFSNLMAGVPVVGGKDLASK